MGLIYVAVSVLALGPTWLRVKLVKCFANVLCCILKHIANMFYAKNFVTKNLACKNVTKHFRRIA